MAGSSSYPAAFNADAVILKPNNWFDDTDAGDDSQTVAGVPHQVGDLTQWLQDVGAILKSHEQTLGLNPQGTFADIAARLQARQTVRKSADQTFSSTTMANVTDMSFAVASGQDYAFEFTVPFTAGPATTTGIGFDVTVPALTGYVAYGVEIFGFAADAAAGAWHGVGSASADAVLSTGVAVASAINLARIKGVLSNPSAGGTLQLRAKTEVASSNVVVRKGTFGELYLN